MHPKNLMLNALMVVALYSMDYNCKDWEVILGLWWGMLIGSVSGMMFGMEMF